MPAQDVDSRKTPPGPVVWFDVRQHVDGYAVRLQGGQQIGRRHMGAADEVDIVNDIANRNHRYNYSILCYNDAVLKTAVKAIAETGRTLGVLFPLLFLFFEADMLSSLDGLGTRNLRGHTMILITSACNAGLLMVPALLIGRTIRILYMLILPLLSLSALIQWYCRLRFSMNLDGDWIGILASTSFPEASAFLRGSLSPAFVLGLLSALATTILATILTEKHQYRRSVALGLAFQRRSVTASRR